MSILIKKVINQVLIKVETGHPQKKGTDSKGGRTQSC